MSLLFLVTTIFGRIPVEIEFRIGGVSPERFDELVTAVATWLEIPTEDLEVSDYEEAFPTFEPTEGPTEGPTAGPTEVPTEGPTAGPTEDLTEEPTQEPTTTPEPTEEPTEGPTEGPTETPSETPSQTPTQTPTQTPSQVPTSDVRRMWPVRSVSRRSSLDDLYTLVFVVYVEDEAAAQELLASVEEKQDQQGALALIIAEELGMDAADIIANPTVVEFQSSSSSSEGNVNSVAGWVIATAIVTAVIAGVFIISYGQNYEPSDAFWFETSPKKSETGVKQVG